MNRNILPKYIFKKYSSWVSISICLLRLKIFVYNFYLMPKSTQNFLQRIGLEYSAIVRMQRQSEDSYFHFKIAFKINFNLNLIRTVHAGFILFNTFRIIAGKFPCANFR